MRAGNNRAYWVKVLVTKPDHLSLISKIQTVAGEN